MSHKYKAMLFRLKGNLAEFLLVEVRKEVFVLIDETLMPQMKIGNIYHIKKVGSDYELCE